MVSRFPAAAPSEPAHVLIVGFGSIGQRHLRVVQQVLPGARVSLLRHAACPSLPEGVDRCVTSLAEAVALRPDVAVIASPATNHLESAAALADAGVQLLVEKPIAADPAGVQALIDRCAARGVVLMVAYNLRFLPSLRALREAVRDGAVGRVLSVRAEIGQALQTWRPGSDYRETVSARADLGGGVLLELSHELDYLRWLFGDPEWVSATVRRQGSLEIDVEDTAHLSIGFGAGAGATGPIATLSMDFLRHDTTRTCVVIGERGTLRWNALTGTVDRFLAGAEGWEVLYAQPPRPDESYVSEWRAFLDAVRDGACPPITGEDGLAVLLLVEAARRSSAAGAVVALRHAEVTAA